MFSNWPTTYGEVVVRAPQRAYQWHSSGIVSEQVSYVVRSLCNYNILWPFIDFACTLVAGMTDSVMLIR